MITENILGYDITCQDAKGCVDHVVSWLQTSYKKTLFCANPHSLIVAQTDPVFQQALQSADLLTPDGVGIILASRILSGKIRERVTGSDIFWELSTALNKSGGFSYFFLGSTPETLDKIKNKFSVGFPNIMFAGSYSPPFKSAFNNEDNRLMVELVNAAKPDVLWVGMTAPKQEKWIFQNKDQLDVRFIGAIGAVFDFYVGIVKRSPPVFQRIGLEWLPRLIREPRRLWRRNFISTPQFICSIIFQRLRDGKIENG